MSSIKMNNDKLNNNILLDTISFNITTHTVGNSKFNIISTRIKLIKSIKDIKLMKYNVYFF